MYLVVCPVAHERGHLKTSIKIMKMKVSKRVFTNSSGLWLCMFLSMGFCARAQRLSRDLNMGLLVNQAGYLPIAGKFCVARGIVSRPFEVVSLETQKVVLKGILQPGGSDLGEYSIGDFTAVRTEGHYYLRSDTLRSYPFAISNSVYEAPIDLIVHYFSLQRCGPSTTGYLAPCHLDDGVRIDNGKHQDVTGGWHDASDLRKWVGATVYGMIGLGKTYELQSDEGRKKTILDELKWGNQYFLKMQEPQGYVMSFVGGDVRKHSDSNRWTDNLVGAEGGALGMVKPNAGKSSHDMLVFGSKDDRVIETDPLDVMEQFVFVTAEAMMSRITKTSDPAYSKKCLAAATKCFDWCIGKNPDHSTGMLGAWIQAALELFKTTGEERFKALAIKQASMLAQLQAAGDASGVSGFFYESAALKEPQKDIWHGCLQFISLCDLVEAFPAHRDVPSWKKMIEKYARDYLSAMSRRNSFGIVPFGLFSGDDPGGSRKVGQYWYRYFMQPELSWWVGINSNLASAGVGLAKASRVLKDKELGYLAQRQLDWIIGNNPFNSSTIEGIGYNHPKHFPGSTFDPQTPVLPGAVLNGLGGDHNDYTMIGDGDWQISEYWTPMASYTMWLMAELSIVK